MSSGGELGLLTESVARARVSDQLWINFVTGAIRSRSVQQSLVDGGNLGAARFWSQLKRFTDVGVGALYTRGAIRFCKHPFDFRADHAEYHNGSGGEWRILRDGRLYKTDPDKIGEPHAWTEPTPFDALDVVDQMKITDVTEVQDTRWGRCQRFAGAAYGGGVSVPLIWRTDEPLTVAVLVDRYGMLRQIDIEDAGREYRHGTTLTLEYRPHPQTAELGQRT